MAALAGNRNQSAALLLALAGIVVLHTAHLQVIQLLPFRFEFESNRFIMKPEIARACSLGFQRLYADLNWLSFIQYYGDRRSASEDKLRHAPEYLRLIIKMDPHFKAPYWFASFVLAGDLGKTREAEEILDEGIKNNPEDWNLLYIAGFNQYFYAKDQEKAAQYYTRASKINGAPEFLAEFAKIMNSGVMYPIQMVAKQWERNYRVSKGAVREKTLVELQYLWSGVYNAAPTERIKNHALEKLKQFDVELVPDAKLPKDLDNELQRLKDFDALLPAKDRDKHLQKQVK